MSDRDGLLQAIIEEPDDDTHRRVFADWLEDHDAPLHARFIRAQLDLAACALPAPDPWNDPAALEMAGLVPELRAALLAPFLPLVPHLSEADDRNDDALLSAFSFLLRRGFIEGLEVYGGSTAALLVMQWPQIAERTPLLHFRFSDRLSRDDEGEYDATDPLQLRTLRALLAQPAVSRLRTLDLLEHPSGGPAVEALMQAAPRLENLSVLMMRLHMVPPPIQARLIERFGSKLRMPPARQLSDDDIPF